MDDRHSALLLQLMQSLGAPAHTHENSHVSESAQFTKADPAQVEHTLLALRPLLAPRQQRMIDLMVKMQEVAALMHDIQTMP